MLLVLEHVQAFAHRAFLGNVERVGCSGFSVLLGVLPSEPCSGKKDVCDPASTHGYVAIGSRLLCLLLLLGQVLFACGPGSRSAGLSLHQLVVHQRQLLADSFAAF